MVLKRQWYIALIKEIIRLKKLAIDQVGSCRITQKFMEDSYISKRKCTLMIFFHEQQSDFRKAVMCNIVSYSWSRKWKKLMKKKCTAVQTDLSKVFECLKHDLFFVKLHVFGFSSNLWVSVTHILAIGFRYQKLIPSIMKFVTLYILPVKFQY